MEHTRAMASQKSAVPVPSSAVMGTGSNRLLGPALEVLAELARTRKQARGELFGDKPGSASSTAREKSVLADARKGQVLAALSSMSPEDAEQAIRQSGRELAAHDAALLAAMQAALHAVLDQFAPDQIQRGGKNDAQAWLGLSRRVRGSGCWLCRTVRALFRRGIPQAVGLRRQADLSSELRPRNGATPHARAARTQRRFR